MIMNLRTDNERSIYRKAHDAVLKSTKPDVAMAFRPLSAKDVQEWDVEVRANAKRDLNDSIQYCEERIRKFQAVVQEAQRLLSQVDSMRREKISSAVSAISYKAAGVN